jgi:hypothetical protein
MFKIERAFLNEEQMPLMWQVTQGGDVGIETWLRENRPLFEALIAMARCCRAGLRRSIQRSVSARLSMRWRPS